MQRTRPSETDLSFSFVSVSAIEPMVQNVRKVDRFDWSPAVTILRTNESGISSFVDSSVVHPVMSWIPEWLLLEFPAAGSPEQYRELAMLIVSTLLAAAMSLENSSDVPVSNRPPRTRAPHLAPGEIAPRVRGNATNNATNNATSLMPRDEALLLLRQTLARLDCQDDAVQADVDWVVDKLLEVRDLQTDLDQYSLLRSMAKSFTTRQL